VRIAADLRRVVCRNPNPTRTPRRCTPARVVDQRHDGRSAKPRRSLPPEPYFGAYAPRAPSP